MSASARGWLAASAPIVLWIAHLTAVASIAEEVCTTGATWVTHALTVGLAAACAPFLWQSLALARRPGVGGAPPDVTAGDDAETADDLRFLGWLGLGMGVASVVLIVAEGLMAVGIGACR